MCISDKQPCSTWNICVSTHRKGPVVSEDKIDILLFPSKWPFFHLNFDGNIFKSEIAFLRYGNFIKDVITD